MNHRNTTSPSSSFRAPQTPMETRANGSNGNPTRDALVAVARDTLDVATELIRDGVALGRLEAEHAVRDAMPRILWGAVAIVCAATASVCAIIAVMIGLEAIIPSIAWRLILLAAVLFMVAFFGTVRASTTSNTTLTRREEPISERPPREAREPRRTDRLSSTILPPPNA